MGCSCSQANAAKQPGASSGSKDADSTRRDDAAPETGEIGISNDDETWTAPARDDEDHHVIVFEAVLKDQSLDRFMSGKQQELCAHIKSNLGCDSVELLNLREGSVVIEACAVGFVHEGHVEEAANKIRDGKSIRSDAFGSHSIPQPLQITTTKMHRASGWLESQRASSNNAKSPIQKTPPASAAKSVAPPAAVRLPAADSRLDAAPIAGKLPPAASGKPQISISTSTMQREPSDLSDDEGPDPPPLQKLDTKGWKYGQLSGSLLMSGGTGCRTPDSDDDDWLRRAQAGLESTDRELLTDVEDTCVNLADLDEDLQVDWGRSKG